MTAEGFCTRCDTDMPISATGFCLIHNWPAIAPSWGRRGQQFINGDWEPCIPKPANYVYVNRWADKPATTPKEPRQSVTYTCAWCQNTFAAIPAGGTPPSYCTSIHKSAAQNARRRAAKQAVAP